MFLFDDVPINFTLQPGLGAPLWQGRTNDSEVMSSVAEKLTELETKAVAAYLSTLP